MKLVLAIALVIAISGCTAAPGLTQQTGYGQEQTTPPSYSQGEPGRPAQTTTGNCKDTDATAPNAATVQGTATGSDGVAHTDYCNADGNLVEYACEQVAVPEPGPYLSPGGGYGQTEASGKVLSDTVSCAGTCSNGACRDICPAQGDTFRITEVTGGTTGGTEGGAYGSSTPKKYVATDSRSSIVYDCSVYTGPGVTCDADLSKGSLLSVSSKSSIGSDILCYTSFNAGLTDQAGKTCTLLCTGRAGQRGT